MKKFKMITLLLAFLAAGQVAQAYEDTFTLEWTPVGNNSALVIRCNTTTVFTRTYIPKSSDSKFRCQFYHIPLRTAPYSVEFTGTLCYSEHGTATVVTEGEFEIKITSSTMKINRVLVMTTVKTYDGEYAEMNYDCTPDNENVVSFQTPEVSQIHINGFVVDYVPFVTLSNFTKLSDNSYLISTKEDLDNLATMVNDHYNDCNGVTFRQGADISFNGNGNNCIGSSASHPFRGTYDGQGHSISNISVDFGTRSYVGIFGYLKDGTVQNLEVKNSDIGGHYYVGGIAGFNNGGIVRNCCVTNVNISGGTNSTAHGGIVGSNLHGSVIGCLSKALLTSNLRETKEYGGIVGNNHGLIQDCIYDCSVIEASRQFGSIAGVNVGDGTIVNNYYINDNIGGVNGSDTDGARVVCFLRLGDQVVVNGAETVYNKSGITAIGTSALRYIRNNDTYTITGAGQRNSFTFNANVPTPNGYAPAFRVNGVFIAGNSYTMPADISTVQIVNVQGCYIKADPIDITGHSSNGQYWSTFSHGILRYALPEGATAYTMDDEKHLHRLGDDGRTIPAGVPVVILADKENITLTYDGDTSEIAIHGNENILNGSHDPVPVSGITSGTPHVLGVVNDVFGFHPFTGTEIPANKAYYVIP